MLDIQLQRGDKEFAQTVKDSKPLSLAVGVMGGKRAKRRLMMWLLKQRHFDHNEPPKYEIMYCVIRPITDVSCTVYFLGPPASCLQYTLDYK